MVARSTSLVCYLVRTLSGSATDEVVGGLPTQMSRSWSSNNLSETNISAVQAGSVGVEAKSQTAEIRRKKHSPSQELIGIEKLFELRRRSSCRFKKCSGSRSRRRPLEQKRLPFHELLGTQQRVKFEIEDKKLSRFHETVEAKKRPSSKKRLRSSRHFMQQFGPRNEPLRSKAAFG